MEINLPLASFNTPQIRLHVATVMAIKLDLFRLTKSIHLDVQRLINRGQSIEQKRKSSFWQTQGPSLIIYFQFYLCSFQCIADSQWKIIAFRQSTSSFAHLWLIQMNEGKRKQSKAKLKAPLNVKIARGIAQHLFPADLRHKLQG